MHTSQKDFTVVSRYFEIHFISDLNALLFLLQLKWVYLKANLLEVGLDPIQLHKYSSKNAVLSYDTVNYDKRHILK